MSPSAPTAPPPAPYGTSPARPVRRRLLGMDDDAPDNHPEAHDPETA
ncbi:hypothetical protein ABZX75_31615 [Streptomyces sp. NPDC003038]